MKRLFIFFSFCASTSQAQVVIGSLGQALDMAAQHNRDMAIAIQRAEVEKQNQRAAIAPLMPQVKAISSLDYNFALPTQLVPAQFFGGRPGEYLPVQFGTKYNLSGGFEANLPLVNTSAWTETGITRLNSEISRLNAKNTEHEVQKNVARAYYMTLISLKAKEISEINLRVSDSVYRNARYKFQNGIIEQLDLNRLQNNFLQVKNIYDQNNTAYLHNLLQLELLLGIEHAQNLQLNDSIAGADPQVTSLTRQAEDFPSVKAKMLAVEQANKYLLKDKLKYIPEISLYARYQAQAQRNSFNFFDSEKSWYNIGVTGLRIDWPLFTGMSRNAAVKRSQARQKISQMELETEKQRVSNDNIETDLQAQTAANTYRNNKNALDLANQNIEIALAKYQQGVFSIDQYLNIYNESLNMQNTYLRSLSDYLIWQAIVELKNKI
jgi:outer membrane protein TolC